MDNDTEQKVAQLQLIEQNLQNFVLQKQMFQTQLLEIESALTELIKVKEAYKIVGNIMVANNSDALQKELKQKKELVELRIKNIEKQENSIKEKAGSLRDDVLKKLKNR